MEFTTDKFIKSTEARKKKHKNMFSLKNLRISLKYRPEILKLVLKMRNCIRKRGLLLSKLKHELKMEKQTPNQERKNQIESSTQTEDTAEEQEGNSSTNNNYVEKDIQTDDYLHVSDSYETLTATETKQIDKNLTKAEVTDTSSQTEDTSNIVADNMTINHSSNNQEICSEKPVRKLESAGWNVNKTDNNGRSIADQVKEAAQSALQQTGMVYVESAGMYYDYKTGYYYNSELGLYYHTDTGCYYCYSDDKKEFVFHSYPDRSALAANASLDAHQRRKARKHKKAWKTEEDIDNITKNLSQGKEDEPSKPKRKKKSVKKIAKEIITKEQSENKDKDQNIEANDTEKENSVVSDENENGEEKEIEDLEDGECSDTASEEEDNAESDASTSTASDDDAVAKHHPPCMRVIVRETKLAKLKVGTLFLVTKDGGTVGREGDQHSILICDHNVSRKHLDIKYDMDRRMYMVTDLGSKNGTMLNGIQMSESQVVSKPMEVIHGSTIQLGETKLLCHIHPGNDTCGHCEPGLLMETQEKEKKAAYTRTCDVQKQHQLELARLKNKYAPEPLMIEDGAYNDRAKARRDAVGSSHHSEKTQITDIDTSIAPENKGFKLLEKMGWSKGEGLGKDSQGDVEPIPLVSNDGKAGLGTPGSVAPPSSHPPPKKPNRLASGSLRLAARSKMLQPPAKAFQNTLEDDSE